MRRATLVATASLFLTAVPAAAHLVGPDHPLADFLRHPAFELPVAAIAIAIGLWAGQQRPRAGWAILIAFPLATIAGAIAAGNGTLPPFRAIAIALSMVAIGGLAAIRASAPAWAGLATAVAAGVYLGTFGRLAHWQGGTGPYPVADLAVAALLLPLAAFQLVRRVRAAWVQIAVRVVGSWIAASGILLLALMLKLR